MGLIKLARVISYSSQNEKFPVENLLKNLEEQNGRRPWLCAPSDKSGRLEAEFQFEHAAFIHYVDVGAYGNLSLELQVGRSSWSTSLQDYITLLPAIIFDGGKNNPKSTSVRMFSVSDLSKEAVKQRWDRLRVICHQLYQKDSKFGLTFLRLSNHDPSSDINSNPGPKNNKTYSSPQSLSKVESKAMPPSQAERIPLNRGTQMLQASRSQHSSLYSERKFKKQVVNFLRELSENSVSTISLKELRQKYEHSMKRPLTKVENGHFTKLAQSFLKGSLCLQPPESPKPNHLKRPSCLLKNILSNQDESEKDATPPLKRKELTRNSLALLDTSVSSCPDEEQACSTTFNSFVNDYPNFDLQFNENDIPTSIDPSSQKESSSNLVECPLCCEKFSQSEIERHAATCEGSGAGTSGTHPCPICNNLFTPSDITQHVNLCLESAS